MESAPTPGVEVVIAQRLTVGLIDQASFALGQLRQRHGGMSKADLINRAISLYEFLDKKMADGHTLLLRDSNGETERLILLP